MYVPLCSSRKSSPDQVHRRPESAWSSEKRRSGLDIWTLMNQTFRYFIFNQSTTCSAQCSTSMQHWTHSYYLCHSVMTRLEETGYLFTCTHGEGTDLGRPSESCTRCKRSSMTWVGPPPPSPKPNSTALWFARPLSLLFLMVLISCGIQWKEWITLTTRGRW